MFIINTNGSKIETTNERTNTELLKHSETLKVKPMYKTAKTITIAPKEEDFLYIRNRAVSAGNVIPQPDGSAISVPIDEYYRDFEKYSKICRNANSNGDFFSEEELKKKYKINENDSIDKVQVWPVYYDGEDGPKQSLEDLVNLYGDTEIISVVELDPKQIFDNVYAVKNYEGVFDIICDFKSNMINMDKMNEIFEDVIEDHLVSTYLKEQNEKYSNGEFKQEKIDIFGAEETQKKIDDAQARYDSGEITIGEFYKEIGVEIEYDLEKVKQLVEDVVDNNYSMEDLMKQIEERKVNEIEKQAVSELLRRNHPETQDRLNREVDDLAKKQKEELNRELEKEKKRIEDQAKADWYYNISFDEQKNPTVVFIPVTKFDNNEEFTDELPELFVEIMQQFNINVVEANNKLKFDDSKQMAKPRAHEIIWTLSDYGNLIYNENVK